MIRDQKFLVPEKDANPWRQGGVFRPDNWMENPYKGKDGGDYHSVEALRTANTEWRLANFPEISRKKVA